MVDFYGKLVGKYTVRPMDASWATSCWPIYDSAAPCGIRCEASTKFAFIACGATMPWRRSVVTTRRAPTIYEWSYNLYKWSQNPYKWSYNHYKPL